MKKDWIDEGYESKVEVAVYFSEMNDSLLDEMAGERLSLPYAEDNSRKK